jgi:hypothetical protein
MARDKKLRLNFQEPTKKQNLTQREVLKILAGYEGQFSNLFKEHLGKIG